MGFTYIGKARAYFTTGGTILDSAETLNIQAGDLLVGLSRWYAGATAAIISQDDDSNTFTMLDVQPNGSGGYMQAGYKIAADADGAAIMRLTLNASGQYRCLIVFQFRPDSGDTVSYDDGDSRDTGTSNNPTS